MTSLHDELNIGPMRVKNRLYRAPVLEGAGGRPDPAETYIHAFRPNAETGVGLIIQGNTIVQRDGQTSPGMSVVETRDDMLALAPVPAAVHAHGAKIVIQFGHGGLFALPSWSRTARAAAVHPMLGPSPPPFPLRLIHPGVHALGTAEVYAFAQKYGDRAAWAREAGYDGVQLASGNAKLIHQFLTPVYNRRDDEFGGSVRNRMRILEVIRDAVRERAGADFPLLVKIPMLDHPRGITLDDGVEMCRMAEGMGFDAITPVVVSHLPNTALCRGDHPAAGFANPKVRRAYFGHTGSALMSRFIEWSNWWYSRAFPFSPVWNRAVFSLVKSMVKVPVFAVGGIRTRAEIDEILHNGQADMTGLGRPFYAEPRLAARLLAGDARPSACENCNRCVPAQMLGLPGMCYNPSTQKRRAELERAA